MEGGQALGVGWSERMRSSLLGIATLALLAGGAIEAVGQGGPTPTGNPGAGADPVGAPALPRPDPAIWEWTAIRPHSKAARDVWFDAIATLRTGEVVVVGRGTERASPARAFVFDRSDPKSWQTVSLPGRKRAVAVDIVAWDDEFIAVATRLPKDGPPQVLIWRSPDGRSWRRPITIDDSEAWDLLPTDEGLALLGVTWDDARRPVPTLWRSTDGRAFEATPVADSGYGVRRVARSPSGTWIVVGQGTNEDGYDAEHVLWRSVDGEDWESIELPFADASRLMEVVAANWTPSGFILVVDLDLAGPEDASGEIWHSPEGFEWTRVAVSEVPFSAVATSPSRQVAFGSRLAGPVSDPIVPAPMVVYASSDGLDWHASRHEELDGVSVTAAAMTTSGELVGVGLRSRTAETDGASNSTVRPVAIALSPWDVFETD